MRDAHIRHHAILAAAAIVLAAAPARAQHADPDGLVRVPPPSGQGLRFGTGSAREATDLSPVSSGWWLGSAGAAAILVACGAVCLGARKHWPQGPTVGLKVVGRMSLSPRHSIVLVQAGPRTLMIGLGPQAAPAMLGELEPGEAMPMPSGPRPSGLDIRLGDDE